MSEEARRSRGYDLAGAAADLAPWDGPPRRSILICTHPRSGSTLVGEMLHAVGGLGVALEYFHLGLRPHLQERLGATDLDEYARAVHGLRTEPDGVFACKLFWRDIEELAAERDPGRQPGWGQRPLGSMTPEAYRRLWALVADLFPNPTFIHLVRQDRLRAAVSAMVATQSGVWRDIPGGEDITGAGEPSYDRERIERLMHVSDYCNGHWTHLFAALGVAPYVLTYEALDADLAGQTAALARHLGAVMTGPITPRMRRQSNSDTEAMVLRFIREQAVSQP